MPKNTRQEFKDARKEYGLYWYVILWRILRPILVFLTSLLIIIGILNGTYRYLQQNYFDPVDKNDAAKINFTVKSGASLAVVSNEL